MLVFALQRIYQERDEEKRIACKTKGITLVEVPYWWDLDLQKSLKATIHKVRPDLISTECLVGLPIPMKPPLLL